MSYLRFSPAEYRAVSRICRRLDLGSYNSPTFQRVLALALSDASPMLAERIGRFQRAEVRLLYDHQRAEAKGAQPPFPSEEWRKLGEACESVPATHRFAHQNPAHGRPQFASGGARPVAEVVADEHQPVRAPL